MTQNKHSKLSGCLFIVAGVAFFVAAVLAEQLPFIGVGSIFLVLGGTFLHKSTRT